MVVSRSYYSPHSFYSGARCPFFVALSSDMKRHGTACRVRFKVKLFWGSKASWRHMMLLLCSKDVSCSNGPRGSPETVCTCQFLHFGWWNLKRLYLAQYWCYVETIAKIRQVPSVDPMDVPIAPSNEKISGNIMFLKLMNLKEILHLENVDHFDGKSKGILDWGYSRFPLYIE